jgi:hypothetical protein
MSRFTDSPQGIEFGQLAGSRQLANKDERPREPREAIPAAIVARRPDFLANRRLDVEKMWDALARKDFAAIQHIGHNSKGIGAGYGFPEISRIGAAIETAAKARDVIEMENAIQQFATYAHAASSD